MVLNSFRSVIELWRTREALAAAVGISNWSVSKWWQRDNIPAEWWTAVLITKEAREAGVSAELLAALAARRDAREPRERERVAG